MLRAALVLSSTALAGSFACGEALAARTTSAIAGDVRALALGDDALTIARQPPRAGLVVERVAGGSAAQRLLTTSLRNTDDQVFMAGSSQALAVGLQPEGSERFGTSHVFTGPAAGPLREVAVCQAGLLPPPVAVDGARVAWRDGGCGDPPDDPVAITPAGVTIAGAAPEVAPTRIALGAELLPVAITLTGDGGLIGALRPSFFAVNSEVRGFGPLGAGPTLLAEQGRVVAPVGVLPDRTRVFSVTTLRSGDERQSCASTLFTTALMATQRRVLDAGGCLIGADVPAAPLAARVAGDRIVALVGEGIAAADSPQPPLVSLISMRGDGSDRRVHAQGSYRPPLGLAAGGDRIAYWHQRCAPAGDSDAVVVDDVRHDVAAPAIASCSAAVLTRAAHVSDGRIAVLLRCSTGCSGVAIDATARYPQRLRAFSYERGTHTLRLSLSKATIRRGKLRLQLAVDAGPQRSGLIRLRR